jgi:hypothetical protein
MKMSPLEKLPICILLAAICHCITGFGASGPGDVVGKVSVGYQGWFACAGDGSPQNKWVHWANTWEIIPSPSNNHVAAWPDMREYTKTYQTGFANLGNGQPATLFSSWDQHTVDTHVRWMKEYGIDTIALQRFGGGNTDGVAVKVRSAAEKFGRKFYIMYDLNAWRSASVLQTDWDGGTSSFTSSSAYAKQNGKPVVAMWGIGMSYMSASEQLAAINYFKGRGCYVIGGVSSMWRENTGQMNVYHSLNMISPWMIGTVGDIAGLDWTYQNRMIGDQADCNANGVDYQPCVLPGDLSQPGQRQHGELMWRAFYNAVRVGCQGIYISMYDEFDEGNQILKTAEDSSQLPSNGGFRALNEDGTFCSSDYYLRLTGDGGRMLKGQIALTATRPTPTVPPTAPKKLVPGTTIWMRAKANNQYVCAENSGSDSLIANRTAVGGWEQFLVVDAGGGNGGLRSLANNRYVCAENSGSSPLIANRTALGWWETFTEVDAGGGMTALRAAVNNQYVCAENAGAAALIANRSAVGPWESFFVSQ